MVPGLPRSSYARRRHARTTALALAIAGALSAAPAWGQPDFSVIGGNVQKRANAVLTLMAFSVAPDVTAGSLTINSAKTDNPSITLFQTGSGFTLASSFPLYLEGFVGFNRYDPTFVATNGEEE